MKAFLLIVCGCLSGWSFCQAQQAVGEAAPFLFVYVSGQSEAPAGPRIALGLEHPLLRINAFAKCARIVSADAIVEGIAVQLQPTDAKVLADALKQEDPSGARKIIWLATPDNRLVGTLLSDNVEANVDRAGVIGFYVGSDEAVVKYLMTKVHPE